MCNLIANAKRRKKDFNLTIEFLQELWDRQGGRCAISGLPIEHINKKVYQGQTASLDRIDSSKGYTEDNVQWVHKTINFMKLEMTTKEFVSMCKIVSNNQDKQ